MPRPRAGGCRSGSERRSYALTEWHQTLVEEPPSPAAEKYVLRTLTLEDDRT